MLLLAGAFGTPGCWWKPRRHEVRIEAAVKRNPKRLKYAQSASGKLKNMFYLKIDESQYNLWELQEVVSLIHNGAIGVIPTDTLYSIVCDLQNRDAVERLYRVKNLNPKKPLSLLCRSFQDIDKYTMGFPQGGDGRRDVFRVARLCLPGPYTFILPASKAMPKQCTNFGGKFAASYAPRKSVGVRIPDDPVWKEMAEKLDNPLLCTSVRTPTDGEWLLDPAIITKTYEKSIDFLVDGGPRIAAPSTVVDMTAAPPVILRTGKGKLEDWMILDTEGEKANPYS